MNSCLPVLVIIWSLERSNVENFCAIEVSGAHTAPRGNKYINFRERKGWPGLNKWTISKHEEKPNYLLTDINKQEDLPDSEEELALHMQITYKQAVEIAEEQALNVLLDGNKYDLIRRRFYYDLATIGIVAVK